MKGRGAIVASVGLVALAVACIDLSVNPNEVGSIEFPPLPNTAILVGDTLRDTTTGQKYPLVAHVFDASGKEDTTAKPTFISTDTLASVVTVNGVAYVVAKSIVGKARVVASAGTLQSIQRSIDVVPVPDTVRRTGVAIDTIVFHIPPTPADTSDELTIQVRQTNGTGVNALLVRYSVVYHDAIVPVTTDTTQQFSLIDGSGRGSSVDTTDASGNASRRLRYRFLASQAKLDSVVVRATVLGVAVKGSPVQFVVILKPPT